MIIKRQIRTSREIRFQKKIRPLALLLCAAMIFPFSSCKNKKKSDETILPSSVTNPASTEEGVSSETIRAQYIRATDDFYSDTDVALKIATDTSREMQGQSIPFMTIAGNTVVVAYHQEYYLTPEEEDEYNHLNLQDPEGSAKGFEIYARKNQYGLAFFSLQGESITSVKMPNQVNIIGIFGVKDGRIGVFTSESVYNTAAGTSDQIEKHITKLTYYSAGGKMLGENTLDSDTEAVIGDYYANAIPMENGNLLVDTGLAILILDPSGKVIAKEEEVKLPSSSIFTNEGKYYVLYTETTLTADKDIRHTYIQEIDPNTGKLLEKKETFTLTSQRVITSEGQCFITGDRKSLCRCDFIKGTIETIIEWSNTNIAPLESIPAMKVESKDDVYLLHSDREGSGETAVATPYLTHLHKEADNPYAGKKTIYVASCVEGSEDFDKLLAAYNKRPESKARVIAYAEEGDVNLGYQERVATVADKMLLDMKSGNGPDILLNCSEFCQFNSKDVLIDLNPYLDGPNGIDRSKYYDNIFRAFEVDGKLYQMPLNVDMCGLVGNPDILGSISTWTIDEFDKKLNTLGTKILPLLGSSAHLRNFDVTEQMGFLLELLFHDMNHYVDYSSYTANFDSDDFRRLLEISKKYGGRVNYETMKSLFEQYDSIFYDASSLMVQDGVCAMRTLYIGGITNGGFAEYANLCHGEAVFLGWPSTSGKGLAADAGISVGISAYSECPDEAWDFVSFMLSPESQSSLSGVHWGGICLHKESEKAGLLRELEEYRDGKRQSDSPASESQIEAFLALVERIDTSIHTDPTIANIVAEEAPAFFNGQKSAEEVSRVIQDRVSRVLAEMK